MPRNRSSRQLCMLLAHDNLRIRINALQVDSPLIVYLAYIDLCTLV